MALLPNGWPRSGASIPLKRRRMVFLSSVRTSIVSPSTVLMTLNVTGSVTPSAAFPSSGDPAVVSAGTGTFCGTGDACGAQPINRTSRIQEVKLLRFKREFFFITVVCCKQHPRPLSSIDFLFTHPLSVVAVWLHEPRSYRTYQTQRRGPDLHRFQRRESVLFTQTSVLHRHSISGFPFREPSTKPQKNH